MPWLKFWGYSFKEHPLTSYDIQLPKSKFFAFFGTISLWDKQQLKCLCSNVRQVGLLLPQDECSGKREKTKDNSREVFEQRVIFILVCLIG